VACSTVCKEKVSSSDDREELQLKTFSYYLDINEEDEVSDPSLNKPGQYSTVYGLLCVAVY